MDGQRFHVFSMKEPDYVMNLMSSYGTTNFVPGTETKRVFKDKNGEQVTREFCYSKVIANHFKYRHVVDDNNNNRMQPLSIEETWGTKDWSHRPFAFCLGVSCVNSQRGFEIMGDHEKASNLQYRRSLAKELIYNGFMPRAQHKEAHERNAKRAKTGGCKLVTLPPSKQFCGTEMVHCNGIYNQWTCVCRAKRVRTYCKCSPGFIRCNICFIDHCLEVENE